jgi:hypothetical protein
MNCTNCCGSRTGSMRSMSVLIMLKIAVFAPNAERQRHDGHRREPALFGEQAEGEAEILNHETGGSKDPPLVWFRQAGH